MYRSTAVLFVLALSACVQEEMPTGVIMPGPDAQSWGILDSAIVRADTDLNADGTQTVTLEFFSAQVSDDELGAAPALICEGGVPVVLNTEVRAPSAQEALADGTLMMIVTCGA